MAFYTYKCSVDECGAEFTLEMAMKDHKDTVDCDYCHSKASANQTFLPDYQPSVKVYKSNIEKLITFDKE